jgi:hypothetical protein
VANAVGGSDELFVIELDVTNLASAEAAVAGRSRPFWSHRRPGEQRRELLLRFEVEPFLGSKAGTRGAAAAGIARPGRPRMPL